MIYAQIIAVLVLAVFAWQFIHARKIDKAEWSSIVLITDPEFLKRFEAVYLDVARRIAAARPAECRFPEFKCQIYTIDGLLPSPYQNRWAVAFPQHADGGNAGGNIVFRRRFLQNTTLWEHECGHIITGIVEHPKWLYPYGANALLLEVSQ